MEDIEQQPPGRVLHSTLYMVAGLMGVLLAWSAWGRLDIIASAEGRLVPQTFVKIVQPADAGIVQDILVAEGQHVEAGQVLMRMDAHSSEADLAAMQADLDNRRLQLRRIDAELGGVPLSRSKSDPPELFAQIDAQYRAHRMNQADTLAQEREVLRKARHELTAARETETKLRQSVPVLQNQAQSYASLGREGFFPALQVQDKLREYQERAQDLKAQESTVRSLEAAIGQSQKRLEQIVSNDRSALQNERVEAEGQLKKSQQEWLKLQHKAEFLELKAPQGGVIKDLATHTSGTVVTPGTILLTLVPENEPLMAEVQIRNDDVGFVHRHQKARIKLVAYPFQKYGMLDGVVTHIGADAQDGQAPSRDTGANAKGAPRQSYRALVNLDRQSLNAAGETLELVPGMQVIAEINQGRRTVLEYLLSPVQRAVHDSARER
jgi:HlyD family secretion protein